MYLVDGYGCVEGALLEACLPPARISPLVTVGVVDDGGGAGEVLGPEAEGVAFEGQEVAVGAFELELVEGSFAYVWDKDLPYSHPGVLAHHVPPAVPVV